jgi:hypothetical protein
MTRQSLSQAGVRDPVLHSARMTKLRSPTALRRFVLDSMRKGSRIASYSQRVGSLSAGSSQCSVVLGSYARWPLYPSSKLGRGPRSPIVMTISRALLTNT